MITNRNSKSILIIGATSAIAQAAARQFAKDQSSFFLVAREQAKLNSIILDLKARGAKDVFTHESDAMGLKFEQNYLSPALNNLKTIDLALICFGDLGDHDKAKMDPQYAEELLQINFITKIYPLTLLANYFEKQKSGTIVVVSSVAGDRGRQSNYIYGSAKAGLSTFLQGLRNRLATKGVQVITIKPGFVSSPMTDHLPKNFLYAKPDTIGRGIYQAVQKKQDVVYLPKFWWLIMLIIKLIPERWFKKMKL